MSKGQKTITHHEFPVITIRQIGKLYDVTGKEVREVRAKLEALGYIEPLRKGSHTHRLLQESIPDNLSMLNDTYIVAKLTYTLPDDMPKILQTLADLIREVKKFTSKNYEDFIKEKYIKACDTMQQAYDELAVIKFPEDSTKCSFACIPRHSDLCKPISKQSRLENFEYLLECMYDDLYFSGYQLHLPALQHLDTAMDILEDVSIPSNIRERMSTKCVES